MPNYFPSKDAELVAWLANFLTVANANLVALGLIADDISPITALQPTYTTKLLNVEAKKAALAAAVDGKDATKYDIIENIRVVVNKIQANPAVTTTLKAELGISTRERGQYPVTPIPPINLVAIWQRNGSVELDWERNGNAPGTQFIIEFSIGNTTAWTLLDIVTRTRYNHSGFPVGVPIQYIVKARRGGEISAASNIAYINPQSGT